MFIRVSILCNNKSKPQIVVLLDEALNALDPELKEKAFACLKSFLQQNGNVTMLHIDHSDKQTLKKLYGNNIIDFNAQRGAMLG